MKIALVNDVPLCLEALARSLRGVPGYEVIWTARDGAEAVRRCRAERPDMILMDLIMPVMNGVEATRQIMAATPCAILVVTATVDGNANLVFEAMGVGALDAVNTPVLGLDGNLAGAENLLRKIDRVGRLITQPPCPEPGPIEPPPVGGSESKTPLVVMGASTGGPQAVASILGQLPRSFPVGVIIAQHVDETFVESLTVWWSKQSHRPVRRANAGDRVRAGEILVAATNDHLIVKNDGTVGYTSQPAECVYRPSVDVLFRSVARNWTGRACGVLLTGMGRDGAEGLLAMRQRGFFTVAQDERSSVVYGMPRAAKNIDAAEEILPLAEIAPAVVHYFQPAKAR